MLPGTRGELRSQGLMPQFLRRDLPEQRIQLRRRQPAVQPDRTARPGVERQGVVVLPKLIAGTMVLVMLAAVAMRGAAGSVPVGLTRLSRSAPARRAPRRARA